ncbi:hypothetical protein [Nocardioides antri]|uniref:Uncharacterized protein n=1 Tax=Nocardioides antri TaxID=2607659 RepID=A0A5B1MAP3_9ACTN|nr:hypothetical protein [Nocardioides antri]KAA1428790.1 hypothetical protein F0U47_00785 [Nocardioides antri]
MADRDGTREDGPGLVVGELRGYRQFDLHHDGLYPRVHAQAGPWHQELEPARCVVVPEHEAPVSGCTCGLYAWYLPGSATVALGPVSAVVAASGRCILGDRGFRAAAARIEAVALPGHVLWNPWAAARARRMLATRYPATRVYATARRMIRDHPPQDLSALGISPPADRSRGYRTAALALSAAVIVPTYALFLLPRDAIAPAMAAWWPAFVLAVVLWQAGIVWLLSRLLALQTDRPRP